MFPEDCNCSQLLNVQIMSKNMALGKFHEISLTPEVWKQINLLFIGGYVESEELMQFLVHEIYLFSPLGVGSIFKHILRYDIDCDYSKFQS